MYIPQAELSPLVLQLAPLAGRVAPETIPFQTLAEGAGSRTLVAQVPAVGSMAACICAVLNMHISAC